MRWLIRALLLLALFFGAAAMMLSNGRSLREQVCLTFGVWCQPTVIGDPIRGGGQIECLISRAGGAPETAPAQPLGDDRWQCELSAPLTTPGRNPQREVVAVRFSKRIADASPHIRAKYAGDERTLEGWRLGAVDPASTDMRLVDLRPANLCSDATLLLDDRIRRAPAAEGTTLLMPIRCALNDARELPQVLEATLAGLTIEVGLK